MTFLHFFCCETLGPPRYGSSWPCPFCDPDHESEWASFSVRPPYGNYPIKWKCHRCHRWGDEWDLLRLLYPKDPTTRSLVLAEVKRLYLRDVVRLPRLPARCSPLGDKLAKRPAPKRKQPPKPKIKPRPRPVSKPTEGTAEETAEPGCIFAQRGTGYRNGQAPPIPKRRNRDA
jgi:hypothetical protein